MKLTNKQRAQVVELLRCAADNRVDGIGLNGMFDTASWLAMDGRFQDLAWDALISVPELPMRCVVVGYADERYRHALLEAAQRVEDKEWP